MYTIFTDTDTDLTPEEAKHFGYQMISMPYIVDGKEIIYTPKSENGVNRYFNYLPMHISCNNDRKSKNYAQLVIVNPDFVANIRKSLLEIKSRISSDKLGQTSYGIHLPDDYFSGIKENIDKQGISKEFFADI